MTVFWGVVFIDDYPAAVGFPPRQRVFASLAPKGSVVNNWAGHSQQFYEAGVGHRLTSHLATPFFQCVADSGQFD
jgi:hypothetical protein